MDQVVFKRVGYLIIFPSKGQIYTTIPECFKKSNLKVRTIIDCSEVFLETPSPLEVQALLWSKYKHHCTFKFLVAITINGAVSLVLPCYGGSTTEIYIVRDSEFLDILEPYDTVMADRGFKIKSHLTFRRCFLAIPPSAAKENQMTSTDIRDTSKVANASIFVEKAIARIKWFRILKIQLPLPEMCLLDDIVICCCSLVNLLSPLTRD